MQGIMPWSQLSETVAEGLREEHFFLIDIGASGGIDSGWRSFGRRLRALGLDPNIRECGRLNNAEQSGNVLYVPAFVGTGRGTASRVFFRNDPWGRLGVARTVELRKAEIDAASAAEKRKMNAWSRSELADPDAAIHIAKFLRENELPTPDFVKIDVDGADYDILQSLNSLLDDPNLLGLGAEVNYVGASEYWEHSFHNTDRYLRSKGFDLFNLTVRKYSNRALPSRYVGSMPGSSELGRPLQGDALYIRDLAAPHRETEANRVSDEKIAKTAALFSLFGLPDCAADVLTVFRERLANVLDIDRCLDQLAKQVQGSQSDAVGYHEWMKLFEEDDERFYAREKYVLANQSGGVATPAEEDSEEWSELDIRGAVPSWWRGGDDELPDREGCRRTPAKTMNSPTILLRDKHDVLVIVPTRSRPASSSAFAEAFFANSTRADLLFALDEDDPLLAEYVGIPGALYEVNPRLYTIGTLNLVANKYVDRYAYLAFMSDGHRIRTSAWDEQLVGAISELPAGIAYGNDLVAGDALPSAMLMPADIVRNLGFMAPPALTHRFAATFWRDLGVTLGSLRYCEEVIISREVGAVEVTGEGAPDPETESLQATARDTVAYEHYARTRLASDASRLATLVVART